jgi:hypothetical protein
MVTKTDLASEFLNAWRHVPQVGAELVENGDRVFVAARQIGVGEHSSVETDLRMFAVWTFRDGMVIHLEHFRDRGAALGAAGLQV